MESRPQCVARQVKQNAPLQMKYTCKRANNKPNAAVSFIRTIPSALESHQISTRKYRMVAGYTAGGEFHPALKLLS